MTIREQAGQLLDKLICNYRTHVSGVTNDPVAVEFIEAALREAYAEGNRDARTEGGGS